jgi:uncharacterized membrane protein YfcA
MSDNVRAVGIGLAAGVAGGLFGVGGGIIIVPGLVLWFGLDQYRAHGTSVAAIAAIAAAALIPFAIDGEVDWLAATALFVGAGIGAFAGARFMARLSPLWLSRGFFVVLVTAAIRMLVA